MICLSLQKAVFAWVAGSILIASQIGVAAAGRRTTERLPSIDAPYAWTTPRVDGSPDDPAWATSVATSNFTISLGPEGAGDVPLPTRARLLWDSGWLYIRFVCFGGNAWSPFTRYGDPIYQQDSVEVFVDAKGDGRQWIEIEISPNNVLFEQLAVLTTTPRYDEDNVLTHKTLDRDWWTNSDWRLDGLKTATGRITRNGKLAAWIVDVALPAKSLLHRYGITSFHPMALRANLTRYEDVGADASHAGKFIPMNWAPVRYGCPHISPRAMGYLRLMPRSMAASQALRKSRL